METMFTQNFEGQTKSIMVFLKVHGLFDLKTIAWYHANVQNLHII